MKNIIFLALATLVVTARAEEPTPPATRLAQLDKIEFADSFAGNKLAPEWKVAKGKWEVAGGALRGTQIPADNHGAVLRNPLKLQNMVVAFDVKLDGAKMASLSINAPKGHLARIRIAPKLFAVQLDDPDHEGAEKGKVFFTKPVEFAAGTWHTVVLEMVGDSMVGTLDGKIVGHGSDPSLLAKEKFAPGFTVAGESASFRNVRIYSAKAEPKADWKKGLE